MRRTRRRVNGQVDARSIGRAAHDADDMLHDGGSGKRGAIGVENLPFHGGRVCRNTAVDLRFVQADDLRAPGAPCPGVAHASTIGQHERIGQHVRRDL